MAFIRRETVLLLAGDLILLVLSLWLALTVRVLHPPELLYFLTNVFAFIPVFAISIVVFFIAGLYEKQTRLVRHIMGSRILGAQIANTVIAAVIFFLLPLVIAPKTILLLYLLISVLLIQAWHFYITPRLPVGGRQQAVLVGEGQSVQEVFEEVNGNNRYRIHFSKHIYTQGLETEKVLHQIQSAIREGVEVVVLDTRDSRIQHELPALYGAMVSGISFVEFASFYEDLFDRVPLAHIDYAWLMACLPKRHFSYDLAKRTFDILGAGFGLVVAFFFVLPAALVLATEGGNPFIFHNRVGRGGKSFKIVKLRTMLFNDHGDPELQKKNRVTPTGAFLRKSRIDELPQLYNVLKGDLSFIGPRPELPKIAEVYEREIPYYGIRHVITPGLSGWAQIRDYDAPRGGADVGRTQRKLSYDLYYLKHRSFGLDLVIALKTLRALASFSGV
jgi:lipopolysaccharide/colanic/teichoic acid biosynthesis glycosyltransferase